MGTYNSRCTAGFKSRSSFVLSFTNDIVYVARHCQIRLFADDTYHFITVDNTEEAGRLIIEDLTLIQTWANQ